MHLTSLSDPVLSRDELIRYETGSIIFKLLGLKCSLARSSVQLQILVDDMLFLFFSSAVATERDQIIKIGECFIREPDFSKITSRLKKENGDGILAKPLANTLDVLK